MNLRYTLTIIDEDGNVRFLAQKPSIEMLTEELGRFERHILPRLNGERRNNQKYN